MNSATRLIVGNWKMNGLLADSRARVLALKNHVLAHPIRNYEIVLCPPATLAGFMAGETQGTALKWGGQDCHAQDSGAFTGDISARMLRDLGAAYVIVGHSERRQYHRETSAEVAAKSKAAHEAGLVAIVCVGETDAERTAGNAEAVVAAQLRESVPATARPENTVIAYEPVWAIGTGKTASAEDVAAMHAFIRRHMTAQMARGGEIRLLYGGSVKASNAAEILHTPDVEGVLVGGASLKAEEFVAIAEASS